MRDLRMGAWSESAFANQRAGRPAWRGPDAGCAWNPRKRPRPQWAPGRPEGNSGPARRDARAQRREARDALLRVQHDERERLQRQVDEQTQALQRSLKYSHEENRRLSETLSYIGHDLRSPLATIVGHARRLARHGEATQREHVHAIERSASYQLSLIDEILDYAKQERAPLELCPEPVDLPDLLADVVRHADSLSGSRHNHFTFEALTALPTTIRIDGKRLQQILLNLISNAAKFTRRGHIKLTVAASGLDDGVPALTFTVLDSGASIESTIQTRLFDAFEQGESRAGGAGLGLHIAHRIVGNMGGELTLRSRPGQGSRFSFTLPVEVLSGERVWRPEALLPEHRASPATATATATAAAAAAGTSPEADAATIPPIELRVDLAKFARDGRLTDIEDWLATLFRQHPEYALLRQRVEQALRELDFEKIETLTLRGVG